MDVDGDGLKDLLFWSAFGGIRWYRNPGNGYIFEDKGSVYTYEGFGTFNPLVATDFDGDGTDDLLVAHTAGSNVVLRLLKFNGASFDALSGEVLELSALYGGAEVSVSDINGDGFPDVVLHLKLVSGGTRLLVFHNQVGAGLSRVQTLSIGAETVWLGLTDMSLDGLEDAIVLHQPSNQIRYYYTQPDGLLSSSFGATPGAGNVRLLADVNADGLKDLIRTLALPDSQSVLVALNTGTGFGPYVVQDSGRGIFHPFDYDQDGDLDYYNIWDIYPGFLCLWENQSVSENRIYGQVFFDANGNDFRDAQEPALQQVKVGVNAQGIYTFSDAEGAFQLLMGGLTGQYEVEISDYFNDAVQVTTSPYPALAEITSGQTVDTVLIGVQLTEGQAGKLKQTLGAYRCSETGRLYIHWEALAAMPQSGEIVLHLPPQTLYSTGSSDIPPTEVSGNTLRWQFDSLSLFTPDELILDVEMPEFQFEGDTLVFAAFLRFWNGGDTLLITDTLRVIFNCAFASQEKSIVNIEDFYAGDQLYALDPPDRVEYLIRFQNTGADIAYQLTIFDNLPPEIDGSTLQMVASSHPCLAHTGPDGLLRIDFPDITLPDSAASFPGSTGFVRFSVQLKPNPPIEVPIRNAARIVFGQNQPVVTNIASFLIVECGYFTRTVLVPRQRCVGEEQLMWAPHYIQGQTYQWTLNGEALSQSDTVTFDLYFVGIHQMHLQIENGVCAADTVVQINAVGEKPDLQWNAAPLTQICQGFPLSIASNISCQWYKDGVLQTTGTNYTATGSQFLSAIAISGSCRDTVQAEVVALPMPAQLINEGEENHTITFCEADTITLSTAVGGQLLWQAISGVDSVVLDSGASDFIVPGNLVDFSGYIYLWVDTLNCELFDLRYLQRVGDSPLSLEADSVWCGQQIGFGRFLNQEGYEIPHDSVFVYYEDSLVNSWYFSSTFYYFMPEAGEYKFEVFTGCLQETFFLDVTSIDELPPVSPVETNFSLQTSTGQGGAWHYAPDLPSGFTFLQNSVSVFQPQDGYYYFIYSVGNNCGNQISDTIYYQMPPCLPPDTLLIQASANAASVSWSPPFPGANYIAYLRPGEPDLPTLGFTDIQDSILLLENLVPYVSYTIEVGLLCPDTVAWAFTGFTLGENPERHSGLFTRCTPRFQRPGGEPGAFYPYDVLPFSVPEDGAYFLATASAGPAGTLPMGLLYEDAFDPDQPIENLIVTIHASSNSDFPQRVDSTVTLSAWKDYFLVSTRENWNEGFIYPDQSVPPTVRFWLGGPAPVQVGDIWYNGRETGPHGLVDEVDASSPTDAGFMCFDTSGWAHFYRVAADPDQYAGDRLKLSLEVYPDLLEAYRIHGPVLLDGLPSASSIVNPPALYVDSTDTWWVMNRFWNFPLNDPQYLQPDGPIQVRFYFTDADYEALRDSILANGGVDFDLTDMYFYKINGFHDPFQLNPANGHPGIYAADAYDAPYGYWEYAPGPEATTSTWKYGVFAQGHYAEMVIRWLSGGGGGLSLSGGGAITVAPYLKNEAPNVLVYPVPASDRVHIQSLSQGMPLIAYNLYDLSGKLRLSQRFSPATGTDIDLSPLPSGTYFLQVWSKERHFTVHKIIKQ